MFLEFTINTASNCLTMSINIKVYDDIFLQKLIINTLIIHLMLLVFID